jgi:hypothetical protein
MSSLGQSLAHTIDAEIKNAVPPHVLAERKRLEEARATNARGERFFAKAKSYFEEGIKSGTPSNSLRMKVGDGGYMTGEDMHMEIYRDLNWVVVNGVRQWCSSDDLPPSMTDPDRFARSWEDFVSWAAANGLEPYWEKIPLSYGCKYLRVRPAVTAEL